MTDKRCSGDKWLYRADIVIVLCPASSWISVMVAPAIASQEQNVCRFECHTYPSIPVSVKHGTNHERVSNREPSRGKTGSPDFCPFKRMDSSAAIESAFRCTVLADPFFVFVRSMVRRSRWT